MMTVEILEHKEAVAARGAELFASAAHEGSESLCVALAGGTTPKFMYSLLAAEPFTSNLPWERIRWFFGDERFVPADHGDSNFRMAKESLFDPAGIDAHNIFRVRTEAGEPQEVAADYEQQVLTHVPHSDSAMPVFDLVLLGMGADGHTASLFPHTSALVEFEKAVAPNYVPAMDTWRITLTAPVLAAAKNIVVLVTGAEKAPALAAVLEGEVNVNTYPAQLLRQRKGSTVWLVDKAAGAELRTKAT